MEDLDQLIAMGMEQGMREAMGQMDAVLADLATFAAGRAVEAQILSDTQVRVSRVIRGTVEQVWRAHHEAALMQRWLLGPDGWTMPVCEVANAGRRAPTGTSGSRSTARSGSASPASCSRARRRTARSPPSR